VSEFDATAADVVGVFDADFNQVFPEGRPIKATIKETARGMEHPIENGSTITDHRVIDPSEITLTLMLVGEEYPDTYGRIKALFQKSELLTVQTKTGSYPSMMIIEMPHDETSDVFDAVPMELKLREVLLVTAQFQALPPAAVQSGTDGRGKRNASTVKRGEQTGKTETPPDAGGQKKSSILYGIIYGDKKTPPPGG
jgi:hypothetical protein